MVMYHSNGGWANISYKCYFLLGHVKTPYHFILFYLDAISTCIPMIWHVADKIDEDYLYNWYRALWELFYKAGFRLYHTTAADSLCLQVTMMESCIYYLSWVHNPGPRVFILHPPADYGKPGYSQHLPLVLYW